jgi:hypothetical protein
MSARVRRISVSGPDPRGRFLAVANTGLQVRSHSPLTDIIAKLLSAGLNRSTIIEVEVVGGRRLSNQIWVLQKIAGTFEGRRSI